MNEYRDWFEPLSRSYQEEDTLILPKDWLEPLSNEEEQLAAEEEKENDTARRGDTPGVLRARNRAARPRKRPVVRPDVAALTLTAVVPAYNEEAGLPETLNALLHQTMPPERIIVVNDGSTDHTAEVASRYPGVEVVTREKSSGSKSRALNSALVVTDTEIILNVDGDTIIGADFVERIKEPFADPQVAVAAGIVQVWNPTGVFQRSRQIEYLAAFHLYRPIQHFWGSPTVCPGAACAYRRELLVEAGGFPDDTVAEDMDFTWRAMLAGWRAVYVAGAECYVIDPMTAKQLKTQLWRWLSGYFQVIRLHWKGMIRRKKVLALIVLAAIWDMASMPLWIVTPIVTAPAIGAEMARNILIALFATDLLITAPVVILGAVRRGISPFWALANLPLLWVNRVFNAWYNAKAMLYELVLVPLGLKQSLAVFKKGH